MTRNLVILAEDDPAQCEVFTTALRDLGYEVRAFDDGKPAYDALKALDQTDRDRAILMTDVTMPKMSGVVLAKLVSSTLSDIPIMGWSKGLTPINQTRLQEAGAHHTLAKTDDPEAIQAAINQTIENYNQKQSGSRGGMVDRITQQSPAWDR